MHFFQLWCPGCNRFSIPLFREWEEKYGHRADVLIVSIHSVFEGHSSQTPDRLRRFVREKDIHHPVGIDAFTDEAAAIPITMKRYRTGGTPHVVIVDKQGRIRFSRLGGFDPEPVEQLIETLLDEEASGERIVRPGPDPVLSGTYLLRFEQTSKSCGPQIPPRDTLIRIEFFGDQLRTTFPQPFLGFQSLEVAFDPDRDEFRTRVEETVDLGPIRAAVTLELWGSLFWDGDSPELDFEVWFRKLGEDLEWDCRVAGRGRARKVS